jgi:predicted alpha/beta superfamily hydrolase
MKKMLLVFFIPVIFILSNSGYSQDYPTVHLPTSIVREIESNIVRDMVYELYIDLPPGYHTSDQTYPVVYLLDAYEIFGLQVQTYQQLIFMKEIPEMIIVGISYKIDGEFYTSGLREYLDIRARDFTPTHLSYEETVIKHGKNTADYVRISGGGKEFLEFIEKELIPFVEKEYRADPENRGLFGYSLGGMFTTYAMFSKPGLFRNYFIGSPFLNWDFRKKINEIKSPFLIIHGDFDAFPMTSVQEWNKNLLESRLIIVQNAGHFPWLEDGTMVFSAIDCFLNGEWPPQSIDFKTRSK